MPDHSHDDDVTGEVNVPLPVMREVTAALTAQAASQEKVAGALVGVRTGLDKNTDVLDRLSGQVGKFARIEQERHEVKAQRFAWLRQIITPPVIAQVLLILAALAGVTYVLAPQPAVPAATAPANGAADVENGE